MKSNDLRFLGPGPIIADLKTSAAAILPFPYEGGVSYGRGTAEAPKAVLEASAYLELYDEVLDAEPCHMGISTLAAPEIPANPEAMIKVLYDQCKQIIDMQKFFIVLGGDHSISSAYFQALKEKYGQLSCIQIDAHADLRDEYEGSPLSHASVMARIREMTPYTLQLGIRSMSVEEAQLVKDENIQLYTMKKYRSPDFDLEAALAMLPDPVFITFDVDAFDWSVVSSTGTPEPGGFTWDESMHLLERIFNIKNVVGADIVELSFESHDRNSPFAIAKLIYKMMGFKLSSHLAKTQKPWPVVPSGPVF